MQETLKSRQLREFRGDFRYYLHGHGIDIGCGDDPLLIHEGTVDLWDKEHGDAQKMKGVPDAAYDFVYSSHCLEHLVDVEDALMNWSRIVKIGGFVYFVVPDYQLYEKMQWPSVYNEDHRHSFSISLPRQKVARKNHWCVPLDLNDALESAGLRIRNTFLEDDGFDYSLPPHVEQTMGGAMAQICVITQKL
jgi:SAM-dependent methyltransferase